MHELVNDSNGIAQMACRRSVCDGHAHVRVRWPDIRLYERFDAVSAPLIVGSGRQDAWARLSTNTCCRGSLGRGDGGRKDGIGLHWRCCLRGLFVAGMTEEAPEGGSSSWSCIVRGYEIVLYPLDISLYDVAGVNPRVRSVALFEYHSVVTGDGSVPDYHRALDGASPC